MHALIQLRNDVFLSFLQSNVHTISCSCISITEIVIRFVEAISFTLYKKLYVIGIIIPTLVIPCNINFGPKTYRFCTLSSSELSPSFHKINIIGPTELLKQKSCQPLLCEICKSLHNSYVTKQPPNPAPLCSSVEEGVFGECDWSTEITQSTEGTRHTALPCQQH